MLVLTRKTNETIIIGDDVDVTILSINGNQVNLGINVPGAVSVHRKEIYQKIKADEQGAHDSTDNTNKGFINELATFVNPIIRYKISRRKPDSNKAA